MRKRQTEAPALLFAVTRSLWLALVLLPGLIFAARISASPVSNSLASTSPASTSSASTSRISTALISTPRASTLKTPAKLGAKTSKITAGARLAHQRKLYLLAQKSYKKGHYTTFKRLSASLKDYPLYPYLEYKSLMRQLKHKPATLSNEQANTFLQENDDSVIGRQFRLKLIKHAARKHDWKALIDVYRAGFGTTAECHYLNALIHTQQAALAWPRIENLWLSSHSQPAACDKVFAQWQRAGLKTPALVWQRFKLAIMASNRQLAGYLVRSMPKKDAVIARKWLKLHKEPQRVTTAEITGIQHPDKASILLNGLKRLSYRDITAAIKAWQQLKKQPFTEQQIAQINSRIGLQLARTHMPEAGLWLARVPDSYAGKQVKEWRIRSAIRQGDWAFVLKGIARLEVQEQSNYRWQYWWAYANEQMGNVIDAQGIYQYLSSKRSYYGFLAADHLNLPYAFEDRPVEPTDAVMAMVSQQPETQRAHEFYLIDQKLAARREWQRLINRINTEQRLVASKIAQSWHWHDRAIITMGRTQYRDDVELRFPIYLEDKVNDWSSRHNIEPAWTLAIMRRESAFMIDARSPVGALGLMQLMPNTARNVARQMKIRYKGRGSLLSSNTNIRLGTGYLQRMLNKLDSQHVLATAAYNAGPSRVAQWLPEHRQMEAIRWIETIPFTETREYVSNVLAYMVIYEHLMSKPSARLSQRMPLIPARNPIITPVVVKDAKQTVQVQKEQKITEKKGPS